MLGGDYPAEPSYGTLSLNWGMEAGAVVGAGHAVELQMELVQPRMAEFSPLAWESVNGKGRASG